MRHALPILGLLLFAMSAHAQNPMAYCPPNPNVAPNAGMPGPQRQPLQTLLFLRLAGPDGMKVTFYRGMNQAVTLDTPCVVGLRPGYVYRVALSGMKKFPGEVFYPTLEVRGSIMLGGNLRACDYPAGLVFKEFDFKAVNGGVLIKKVIFLERVADAIAESSPPESPVEITVEPPRDPIDEARDRGLPVMTMMMGQIQEREVDLITQGIYGTILLAGESYLPFPPRVPCAPWMCYPIYDPLLGAAPWQYYRLINGGDWGPPIGYNAEGKLVGVEPSKAVAEFTRSDGFKGIALSNRVCLCIPRFLITKTPEILNPLSALNTSYTSDAARNVTIPHAYDLQTRAQIQQRNDALVLARSKIKPSGTDNVTYTNVTGRIDNLDIKAAIFSPKGVTGEPTPPGKGKLAGPELPDTTPLRIIKWPDRCASAVGEFVTFYIQYINDGRRPITNVAVTDSLITRFKYVEKSAKSDHAATFSVQSNEANSTILRWEFNDTLRPGESGIVSFKVQIQ